MISAASDSRGRTTVCDLIDCRERIYPLGRLDYDSSGLLLLSNDGELMNRLIHPSFAVEKVYEVSVDRIFSDAELKKIESGVPIEDYVSAPCRISLLRMNEEKRTATYEITIHEGKNREIRRMMAYFGAKVKKLHRIREANLELGDLRSGEYRMLKPYEVKKLKAYLNGPDR